MEIAFPAGHVVSEPAGNSSKHSNFQPRVESEAKTKGEIQARTISTFHQHQHHLKSACSTFEPLDLSENRLEKAKSPQKIFFSHHFSHQDTLPSGTSSRMLGSRRPSTSPAMSWGLGAAPDLRESKDRVTSCAIGVSLVQVKI